MIEEMSVLVVDDNVSLLVTMSLILRRVGYSVMTAKSGKEAVECVKQNNVHIIFMDIKMPHKNGVDVYKELKKMIPEVPVVMMTAYTQNELIQEGINAGVYDVLYKPLDMDQVIDIIRKVDRELNANN
jgi:DNA-binding NtrC family response regulator